MGVRKEVIVLALKLLSTIANSPELPVRLSKRMCPGIGVLMVQLTPLTVSMDQPAGRPPVKFSSMNRVEVIGGVGFTLIIKE